MTPTQETTGLDHVPNESLMGRNHTSGLDFTATDPESTFKTTFKLPLDLSPIINARERANKGKPCYRVSPIKVSDKMFKTKTFSMPGSKLNSEMQKFK